MKKLLIVLAAVALAGCFKVGKTLPKDMPSYVSVYPGAELVMTLDMGAMTTIGLRTSASPDDVIGYYRTQATANGMQETAAPQSANATADQRQAMFRDSTGKQILMVSARPQNNETTVALAYNKPAAGSP